MKTRKFAALGGEWVICGRVFAGGYLWVGFARFQVVEVSVAVERRDAPDMLYWKSCKINS